MSLSLACYGEVTAEQIDLRARLKQSLEQGSKLPDQFLAEIWFKSMMDRTKPFLSSEAERFLLLKTVHTHSQQHELDPALVLAIIEVESGFDRFAVSRTGAQGLMQVMSFWKNEIGRQDDNLIQTETNLHYGTTILRHYLDLADGNYTEALARYNGSHPKTWYAERVFKALDRWR